MLITYIIGCFIFAAILESMNYYEDTDYDRYTFKEFVVGTYTIVFLWPIIALVVIYKLLAG